jgi:hypothetical protein
LFAQFCFGDECHFLFSQLGQAETKQEIFHEGHEGAQRLIFSSWFFVPLVDEESLLLVQRFHWIGTIAQTVHPHYKATRFCAESGSPQIKVQSPLDARQISRHSARPPCS